MNNSKMNVILEGLHNESKDSFVEGGSLKDVYVVVVYPISGNQSTKQFNTYEKAEEYAVEFLRDLKNKKQIVPNFHRRAEIVYQGKTLKVLYYDDVVNESSFRDDDDFNNKVDVTTADLKLLKDVEDYAKRIAKWSASVKKAGDISSALRYALSDCKRHLEEDLKIITDATMDMK